MVTKDLHIIMPIKDSIETAEQAIRAIVASGNTLTVYDDNSQPENAAWLDTLGKELGIDVMHVGNYTNHPSPNYRWVLMDAQRKCIAENSHLVIVESDVIVKDDTLERMRQAVQTGTGLVAAVTMNEQGEINFPYTYARKWKEDKICKKRLSFCCTLLTNEWLRAYDFANLDPKKNWYDVHISHMAIKMGFTNILQTSNPVLHNPHSSRPWKQIKYTNPLLYYWRKIILRRDKI